MAFVSKREEQPFSRLTAMTQPEATPTKRVGTEAPIGAVTAGPSAGKSAAEFTKSSAGSPGSVFNRQLAGANISGITSLAERPLLREAGEEARRVAGEGFQYKKQQEENLAKQPQITDYNKALADIASGKQDTTQTAQTVLTRQNIPVQKFDTADIKEFTPLQALRGGSVESLLKKEAAGPYTTGMAGLDALLFAKKGGAAELGERGKATRGLLQGAVNILEGGEDKSLAGEAAKRLEGFGFNLPLTSLTGEAEKKAADLVQQQRAGLTGALTGEIGKRRGEYEAGLEPLRFGRAATVAQQNQAIMDYYRNLGAGVRTKMLEGMPTGNPIVEGYIAEGPDIPTVLQNIRNVDIESVVRPYLNLPEYVQPTIADVAAQNPETATGYQRLLDLMQVGGQDVSKYNLGATTRQEKPTVTTDEESIKKAIEAALTEAGSKAPRVRY